MVANRSNEPTKPIEIEIQARDSASKVIKDTSVAFANLKDESTAVAKSLSLAGASLTTVAAFADTARLKVLDTSTAMAGLGVATVTTVGLITSKITGLFSLVGELKRTVQENPVANNFFSMIGQQAEEAISQTASLSDNIRAISNIAVPVGEGFAREILKLDTTPISEKISKSVSQGVRGITGAVFNPIEEALGFSVFSGTQRAIGTALQSLDKSLAKDAISSFFDFTLGVGPVRALVEDIATSPAIAQYSPQFIQSLLGGSASAAVDDLTGSIAGIVASQVSGNSPLASLLIGTGFNNQIQDLASTEVQTVFQGLNSQLANFTLENRIVDIIGNNTSASFVKGILKQPLITNILNPTVQALATGNFTEAIALALENNLSKTINNAFEVANRKVVQLSSAAGRATLSRLLDGGAKRKAEERLKELKDGLEEEKNILDARKAIIENNFQLDERILTDKISQKQRKIQSPGVDDAEKEELEKSIAKLTSDLGRLRNQQSSELSKFQGEYKIYESKVRGVSGEISELEKYLARNNRTESIIGDTFSGVGERFLKGVGFGSKISLTSKILPAIFDLSTGNITGMLSGYIGGGLSDALDKIFPEINGIASEFAEKITRIQPLDDLLGKGVAIAGGKAIDQLIPKLLNPVVNGTIDTLLDGLQQGGGRETAQAINRYLPGYLQNVGNLVIDGVRGTGSKVISNQLAKFFPPLIQGAIADGIQSTGISKVIFTKIFENLNPQILKANLTSLSENLGSLSNNIVSALSKIEVFVIKTLYGIQRAIVFTVNSVSYIQDGISRFVSGTNSFLDNLSNKIVGFYGSIVNATNQGAASATNLLDKATQLLERLKGGDTTGTKVAIIESVQNGIAKATQAIGFLQAKILDLADSGLELSFGGIENFRDFINKVDTFSQNIIPNIKTGVGIAFDLAIAGVDKLNSLALKTLSFAVSGIENIKNLSPQVIDYFINGISGIQGGIANILSGVDAVLTKIIDSGKLDVGAFDFLSQVRINLQGLGANIDQELVATRQNLRLSKLKNIVSDVLVNGMKDGGIKDLAKTINSVLPSSLQTIGNLFIDGIRGTGSKYTANILASFFPKSARDLISKQLQDTGISSKLFDNLFKNINPTSIKSGLLFIDQQLAGIKPIVQPLFDGFTEKAAEVKIILTNFAKDTQALFSSIFLSTISKVQAFISASINSINSVLSTIESRVISVVNGITSVTRNIAQTLTKSLGNVYELIEGLKAGQSGFKLVFLEGIQTGIDKAITAIGYLQSKISTLANNGLNVVLDAIDNIRDALNTIAQTSGNIIPILQGIFNTLTKNIQNSFDAIKKAGIDAWNAFPENLAKVLMALRSQIDGARNIISSLFGTIDKVLEKIISSGRISVGAFDFLSGARDKISGFATALRQQQQNTANSADETKRNFLELATNIQNSFVNAGSSVTKFADNVKQALSKARTDTENGIDTGLPTQIIGIYNSIGNAIASVVGQGLFDPTAIQDNIQNIRDAIQGVIPSIDAFSEILSTRAQEIRNGLNTFFGDSAERFGNFIGNLFDENTTDETAIRFRTLLTPFQEIFGDLFRLTAQQGQRSFLAGILGEGFDRIAPALDLIDRSILNVYRSISSVASQTSQALDVFSLIPGQFAGFNEPLAVFGYFEQVVGSVAGGVSFLSEKLSFFTQGLSSLQQLTQNGPFKLLIGQTVELREQLLATQASLVGTSAIFNKFTGQEIKDPTTAIKSLDLPILSQIERLRTESLELVGVTSNDLVPLFQQVASRITSIGGSLTDAKNLSLDFAAALGTLNIPLAQSQQEISSILTGQIDQNSALAKSLNITNEQVNLYKSQGRLVEELRKRLEAFRAGNKLASESLSGYTGNIREIFDEIGRKAGQKLLDPLLNQVSAVYKFLQDNQQQLITYFEQFSTYMLRIGSAITNSIKTVAKSFEGLVVQAPIYLFKSLTNAVEAFNGAIQFAAQALAPVVNTLSAMLSVAGGLGGPMLGLFLTTKVLSGAVSTLGDMFGVVTQLIPGLGELLFFLDVRSGGVIDQFANLSKILGVGASGFLVLGKNLESIPGAMGVINQALGPVGGLVAGFIPTLSGVGIQLAGLVAIFPVLGSVLSNFITQAPAMARAIATLATASIYTAPLAPLFTQAAVGLDLYADASTRQAIIGGQLTEVLRSIGKAVASNVLTLGFLAAGTYAAFLAFDAFVLKNETVRQVLSAVGDGLKTLGGIIADVFGNEMVRGITIATALSAIISLGLIPSVRTLIGLQLGVWAGGAAAGLEALSAVAKLLGLTNLTASLLSSSIGFQALRIAVTSGTVASAQFLATNGISVKVLGFLPPSLAAATTGLATFTTALYTAIAPMLPIIATAALVVAAIAGIGLAVQKQKLGEGIAEVEEYGRQLENASDQSLKLAQSLKRAGDAQAEANKRGVQLTKEQYAENAKLLKQTELQAARLDDEIKNRQEALKAINGDENKAALQAQIDDLKRQKEQLLRLSGDAIQTQPKEILDKGSVFEQLRIKAEGAKAAIEKPADDTALKQKSQELIEITQQQLELGAITAEEARKNLSQVANNAKVEQDIRIKAQKAIAETYKSTSRVDALKAESELINAQLAAGLLDFADNAKAIADIQNSALNDRMTNEEAAHKATMKRLQDEYEGKKLLLEQDLLSARLAASKNAGTEEGKQQLARAEEISRQLQQLDAASNQQRQDEAKRNGEVTTAITQEIAANQAKQIKLAKELEKQVRDGSISEEQAALRQSSEAKKAELAQQLKSSEDAYKKQKELINQQLEQDVSTAQKQVREKIEAAAKLPVGSKEYQTAIQDAAIANAKIQSSEAASKQALLKAEREYNTETAKLSSQSLQAQADNEKKQRDAAIKFLDAKQKEAQDVLQKSQNQQLINIQKLETAGLSIKEQSEFQKTKLTGEQIALQLQQEQEKLKKLESLEKPKGQQERLALDAQIRGSRLKTQELIRQGLENEQKAYDGIINLVKANIKLEGEAKETKLERQRLMLGEAAIAQTLARQKVTDLEKELSKETKNIARRSALILELEKARTAARRAAIADELNDFDDTTTQLQAGLESRYNKGQASESRIKVIEAQRAVERAQKELNLEKDNVDKKYKLQLALEKAKTALLDAQIAERQKLIETENQEYLNQIEEQNQAIKRQSMLYEVMASALTERNKVLEASKNLAAAAAGFMTSELDVLSKIETSEYRRKQLAEIAAAIKLEALAKQQEFERESLENQILQNKYALEREAIQNRINQATKIAEIAKQQAEIEAFKADPRNESRSGRAQLRAKELSLEANQYGLVQLRLQGGLIQKQQGGQDELAKMQRRSLELKQKGDERQAEADLVLALPPGRRQRAQRALGQQIAEEQGYNSVRDLINAGLATSRGTVKKRYGITPSIDLLGAVDPELASLLENLSPSQQAAAIGNVQSNFNRDFGGTQSLSNVSSPNPTGKPLQLLPEFQGKLTLPSPAQRGSSIVNLEKSGNLFQTGVEKLIDYLDGQKKDSKSTSYNINITSPVGNTSTSGTANKVSTLEDTLRIAKQLAGIR